MPFIQRIIQRLSKFPITITAILMIAAATGQQIVELQGRTFAEFERRASVAAEAAAAYVDQALSSITLAIQAIDGDATTPAVVLTSTPAEIQRALRRVLDSSPLILGLGFVGRDGRVVVSATSGQTQRTDLSDRTYFQFHRDSPSVGLHIERPVVSRPENVVSIPVSMRAETVTGEFDGLVAARLDPSYFSSFFSKLGVGAVNLVDSDGHPYARFPVIDLISAAPRPMPGFTGSGRFTRLTESGEFLVGYSVPVGNSGLFVRSTNPRSEIYETWLRRSSTPLLLGLVAAGLTLTLSRILRRRVKDLTAMIDVTVADAREAHREAEHFRDVARTRSDFLAHMSHEIRTPLNAIIGFSEVISGDAMKLGVPARYRDYAADIRFSAEHLLSVINRILDMSKIEAGKWTLSLGRVNAASLVHNVAHLAAQRAQTEGVTLEVDAPDPHLEFTGDAGVLDQLLLNLVINAIKFAGPDRKVRLGCRHAGGDRIEFTVADKGPGMSEADAARALRPFETAAAPGLRAKSDTGLGLPLSRMFAELHGGTLELDSAPGKGTCARVILPVTHGRKAPAAA